MKLLSGGRKRRPRLRRLAHWFWIIAVAVAVFFAATVVIVRL